MKTFHFQTSISCSVLRDMLDEMRYVILGKMAYNSHIEHVQLAYAHDFNICLIGNNVYEHLIT